MDSEIKQMRQQKITTVMLSTCDLQARHGPKQIFVPRNRRSKTQLRVSKRKPQDQTNLSTTFLRLSLSSVDQGRRISDHHGDPLGLCALALSQPEWLSFLCVVGVY